MNAPNTVERTIGEAIGTQRTSSAAGRTLALWAALASLALLPSTGRAFVVDSPIDERDAWPGDGQCATAQGACTLRAAVEEANAVLGPSDIDLPPGLYGLTLGQLEITDDLTIRGVGSASTVIDGGGRSRLIEVLPESWLISERNNYTLGMYTRDGWLKETVFDGSAARETITAVRSFNGIQLLTTSALRTFDPNTRALTRTIPLPQSIWNNSWPSDVYLRYNFDVSPIQEIAFFLDFIGNRVVTYNLTLSVWGGTPALPQLSSPNSLVEGPDHKFYITNVGANDVVRWDPPTSPFESFVPAYSGGLAAPRGLAFGRDGNLYVAGEQSNAIFRYDGTTGASLGTFVAPGSGGLKEPVGLAFGPDGDLYVVSGTSDTEFDVLRFDGVTGAPRGYLLRGGAPGSILYAPGVGDGPSVVLRGIALMNGRAGSFAGPGGGLLSRYASNQVAIIDCLIQGNSASVLGGGISNAGFLHLERSRVTENHTEIDGGGGVQYTGGGIYNIGHAEIDTSVIDTNQATRGGGIANWGGDMRIVNSTISYNDVDTSGGGILNSQASLQLSYCTITENSTRVAGGASEIALGGGLYNDSQVMMANTIVAANHDARDPTTENYSPDCYTGLTRSGTDNHAQIRSDGGNIIGTGNTSCTPILVDSDRIGTNAAPIDPELAPLQQSWSNNWLPTHVPLPGSPAIDAAVSVPASTTFVGCPDHDQGDIARPLDGDGDGIARCDIGAAELQPL